jgi:uncharacterized protein with GYD domain
MATFVVLYNWTDQGVKSFTGSPSRVDEATEMFAGLGVELKELYWTLGAHDLVGVLEAPDDESMTAAMLKLARPGTCARRRCALSAGASSKPSRARPADRDKDLRPSRRAFLEPPGRLC